MVCSWELSLKGGRWVSRGLPACSFFFSFREKPGGHSCSGNQHFQGEPPSTWGSAERARQNPSWVSHSSAPSELPKRAKAEGQRRWPGGFTSLWLFGKQSPVAPSLQIQTIQPVEGQPYILGSSLTLGPHVYMCIHGHTSYVDMHPQRPTSP